ncbi:MAG: DnaJ domain-containing protein [Hyphomicrobiaceae bacterium]|nr:DnaJ domain-containing protein [Hyphomicrobiaceae bacterium]
MYDLTAVRTAIDLLHVPWRVRIVRAQALPKDVSPLLRVAAGDRKVLRWISEKTDRSKDVIQDAADFYIEQILMAPDADSYRVLGARPEASMADLRRNMAWLVRLSHPDVDRKGKYTMLAMRVTSAWENLKTPDRRAAYDELRKSACRARRVESRHSNAADVAAPAIDRGHKIKSSRAGPPSKNGRNGANVLQRILRFLLPRARHKSF